MTGTLHHNPAGGEPVLLPLKSATVLIPAQPNLAIDRVSLEYCGRRKRSVRLTFLPKNPDAHDESGAIEIQLSRVQAWALAQWIIDESTKRTRRLP
jgi:hypothetical protein